VAIAFIGLGSNLDDPETQVRAALDELGALSDCRCLQHSSLYRSIPLGPSDQPNYVNAVAMLETSLAPPKLLVALQYLEVIHRRVRGEHWGPRTLDLDLLLYDDRIIDTPELRVPHPGLYERNFVLYPLAEIVADDVADFVIPGRGTLEVLLSRCRRSSLERIIQSKISQYEKFEKAVEPDVS
jgi:2-amino-4-hydroxy-6-hydroxymethyldihydropteridine diphosphokinase